METPPKKKFNRRHTFFINPQFQGRFIALVILSNFGICLAFYLGQLYFFRTHIRLNQKIGIPENDPLIETLKNLQVSAGIMYMSVFFLVTFASVIMALHYSHRIAGPLYHLKKFLKDKLQGNDLEKTLRFRKGDYFKDLADVVNEYREHFKEKK